MTPYDKFEILWWEMTDLEILFALLCCGIVLYITLIMVLSRSTKAERTKEEIKRTQENLRSRSRCRIW
jgi:ABC-type transport system involved in cytochrome bd biosynthesis fused ATPase/permease subunit